MEIDINYALVYYITNVNIYEYHWKSYGHAIWYDTRKESYHEASIRVKDIVWEEILSQNKHLVGTEIKYIESGEMPIIQVQKEPTYFDIPTEERPGTHLDTSSPEFIKMQIETCKSLAVLKAVYPKLIKGNVELETIYNQKLDELNAK